MKSFLFAFDKILNVRIKYFLVNCVGKFVFVVLWRQASLITFFELLENLYLSLCLHDRICVKDFGTFLTLEKRMQKRNALRS